jgi:DNA repair exonuclease SbcCD ATPase subunit
MHIKSIDIQGFRSFASPQTLDFDALRPGLYHVAGRNGSGKSSLFEAVHWALYGKTSRGLKAGSVKSWTGKEKCSVILNLKGDSILREHSPNVLECRHYTDEEAHPIDQTELEVEVLQCPQAAFTFAVYFPQFAPSFIDLERPQQTKVFTEVLKLHKWEAAAGMSNGHAADLEQGLAGLREQQTELRGQAKELLAVDYGAQERAWDDERRAKLATAARGVKVAEAAVLAAEKALAAATKEVARPRPALERLVAAADVVRQAEASLREQRATVRALQDKDIRECPTCGAPMSDDHVRKELEAAGKKEVYLGEMFAASLRTHEKLGRTSVEELDAAEAADANEKIAHAAVTEAHMHAAVASGNLNSIRAERNPYTKAREQADARGEALAQQLDEVSATIAADHKLLEDCKFWTKGFKEIRLLEIERSLAQLTLEVNEVLFQIGLPDWSIEFEIERETKKGTIDKNFTTFIRAPGVKSAVPWEAWSGGESQRLRLAISMGFANLIGSRMGTQPNVEFWDEPSTWLDDVGGLLEVLSDRARRYNRLILLADHRVLEFGGFAGTINIVKTDSGSRIETALLRAG